MPDPRQPESNPKPAPHPAVTVRAERGIRVMRFPPGRLDGNAVRQMYELTVQEIHQPNARLLIDLTGITLISSTGLGMLITLRKKCLGIGAQMLLAVPNPNVRETFHLMNLHHVLPLHDTPEQAYTHFKPPAKQE